MKIALLLTGNELMTGDTVDSNSAFIAQALLPLGLTVRQKVTVGDDPILLQQELLKLCRDCDLIIMNGGLGPTVDDLTAEILAKASATTLAEHPEALQHIQQWCKKLKVDINAANLKQAMLPKGCSIIANAIGSAVGFEITIDGCRVLTTPGVPSELHCMMNEEIIPDLQKVLDDHYIFIEKMQIFGLGESSIQQMVSEKFPQWPANIELGFRAGYPLLEIKLTSYTPQDIELHRQYSQHLRVLLGSHIVADGSTNLPKVIVNLLTQKNKILSTAESCTGGLIATMITEIAGASAVFEAGFVTYSNAIKHSILDVSNEVLEQQGAVSKAVVLQMAESALRKSGSDYTIAVSGIAGPDGGSDTKPVGLVWIAWGDNDALQTVCLQLSVGRKMFQNMVAAISLDLIRRQILGITERSHFVLRREIKA